MPCTTVLVRLVKHITNVLGLFLIVASVHAQETEEKVEEKANKLFDNEQYVDATPFFLRLISLHPTNVSYNFKYGTCLLFNSDNEKKEAIRYLNFAVNSPDVDPKAFYFKGRALHLNYQFKEAKKYYQLYQSKCSAGDNTFDVDHEIEMCNNGGQLLSTFTEIIVTEKKPVEEDKFFRLYHDMESFGGKILVTERFQSRIDKKKGHVPIVHFPKNATTVYYSSYGEKENSGLDIYIRRKLPDNSWGNPTPLPGAVNTPYDDDFPYLHPSGKYLYFSSKGHNSMGGFDVFMARYNSSSNIFERVENVDFAISSPDDDLFYVVDSSYQNAYFASARQSESGKLHVYRVKVVRIPVQEIIVMGDFLSEINPDNTDMTVTILSASGEEIGKIASNSTGSYSHVFPQGGKYTYQIDIVGLDKITELEVELPYLDEFRPLKQKVVHTMIDGMEAVKIVNLFDERIEGGSELIGYILREKAELDVNIDEIDPAALAALELAQRRDEILAEIGLNNMTPREVQNKLAELTEDERDQAELLKKLSIGINNNIVEVGEELKELLDKQNILMDKIALADDPFVEYAFLNEASALEPQIEKVSEQITSLNKLNDELEGKFGASPKSDGDMASLEIRFNKLMKAGDEEAAWNLLAQEKGTIYAVQNISPRGIIANMIDESIELKTEQRRIIAKNNSSAIEIDRIKNDVRLLKGQLANAKKRKADEMSAEILQKEQEIDIHKKEEIFNHEDITALNNKVLVLEENVQILEEALSGKPIPMVTPSEIEKAVKDAKIAKDTKNGTRIKEQMAVLENLNPELVGSNPGVAQTTQELLTSAHEDEKKTILGDKTKTELVKTQNLLDNNKRTSTGIAKEIQSLQTKLESDPGNNALLEEQLKLVEYKNEIDSQTTEYIAKVKELEESNPEIAVSADDIINGLLPNYLTDIASIDATLSTSELSKLEQRQDKDTQLKLVIDERLIKIKLLLDAKPDNPDLQGEMQLLKSMGGQLEEDINVRGLRIKDLKAQEATSPTIALTLDGVRSSVFPSYREDVNAINDVSGLSEIDKLKQLQLNDNELKTNLQTRLITVRGQLESDPTNPDLLKELELLETIESDTDLALNTRDLRIKELEGPSPTSGLTLADVKESVFPDYEKDVSSINGNRRLSEVDKLKQLQLKDNELKTNLQTRLITIFEQLESDPTNPDLLKELELLETIGSDTDLAINTRD
ncbi:MAG: hypothetical protein ACI837_001929, partial [Crocinitomicaceae bacterium]